LRHTNNQMNSIIDIDKMFVKRFYLPYNADISKYESGKNTINSCICGHYNHICCVFRGGTKHMNILSYGTNVYAELDGKTPGIHAEYAAISKLPRIRKEKKRLERIDICVVRLSKTKKIQCSKPCHNCIKMMCVYPNSKGYQICNVYYSNADGDITRTTLARLLCEEPHYSRYYTKRYTQIQNKDMIIV
jgi:hypothetical protein